MGFLEQRDTWVFRAVLHIKEFNEGHTFPVYKDPHIQIELVYFNYDIKPELPNKKNNKNPVWYQSRMSLNASVELKPFYIKAGVYSLSAKLAERQEALFKDILIYDHSKNKLLTKKEGEKIMGDKSPKKEKKKQPVKEKTKKKGRRDKTQSAIPLKQKGW